MTQKVQQSLIKQLLQQIEQQNSTLIPQDVGLQEFQWFDLETKIRLLVYQLLEPHMKDAIEQRQEQQLLSTRLLKYIDDYDQFKGVYFQNTSAGINLSDVAQAQKELSIQVRDSQIESTLRQSEFERQLENLAFLKNQQQIEIQQLKQELTTLKKVVENEKENSQSQKRAFAIQLEQTRNDQTQSIMLLEQKIIIQRQWNDQQESKLQEEREKLQMSQELVKNLQRTITEVSLQCSSNMQQIQYIKKDMNKLDNLISQDSKLQIKMDMMGVKQTSLESYLERYLGLHLQGSISDVLHSCLDEQSRVKLAEYEERRFSELHKIILDDTGVPNLDKKMMEYAQMLEKVQKRSMQVLRELQPIIEIQKTISSQISYPSSHDSVDSSERVGVKGSFRPDREELEGFLFRQFNQWSQKFNEQLESQQQIVHQNQSTVEILQEQVHNHHITMTNNITKFKAQQDEEITLLQESFRMLPKQIYDLQETQNSQQSALYKLIQHANILHQLHLSEASVNGETINKEDVLQISDKILSSLKFESPRKSKTAKTYQTLYTLPPNDNSDDECRKLVRVRTFSSSNKKQQQSTSTNKKLYLLGSKIQSELSTAYADSLQPRRLNNKMMYMTKKQL